MDGSEAVLETLYGHAQDSAAIPAPTTRENEDLLLRIWHQQWPALRFQFSLCSGSIAPRHIESHRFDLEVCPPQAQRTFEALAHTRVVDTTTSERPPWVAQVAEDLKSDTPTDLRRFLWFFAEDVKEGKRAFAGLVKVYDLAREVERGDRKLLELVQLIAREFPQAGSALRLKAWSLGDIGERESFVPRLPAPGKLAAHMLDSDAASAFNSEQLRKLWNATLGGSADPHSLTSLSRLLRQSGGPARTAAREVLAQLPANELVRVIHSDLVPIEHLLALKPDLSSNPLLWTTKGQFQRAAIAYIRTTSPDVSVRVSIIQAMLEAGSDAVADEALDFAGFPGVESLFSWRSNDSEGGLRQAPSGWFAALRRRSSLVIAWLETSGLRANPTQLAVAALVLDPHLVDLRRLGIDMWLSAIPPVSQQDDPTRRVRSFLLAFALHNPPGNPSSVVAETFQPVYDSVEHDDVSWYFLEPLLPGGWSWIWTPTARRERLARGVIERFIAFDWPAGQLARAAKEPNTLKALVSYARSTSNAENLVARLQDAVGETMPSDENPRRGPRKRRKGS